MFTDEQLGELERRLVADLDAVRRTRANKDLARVSSLLAETKTPLLFETPVNRNGGPLTAKEVKGVVLKFATPFGNSDVVAAVEREFPGREVKRGTIPSAIHSLKTSGKIRAESEREGRNGATYVRI